MALELKIVSPSPEGFVQEIIWNADEIAAEVAAKVGYYKRLVYTEDQVAEAKKDRAQLNKFITALKDKDREIKGLCLKPYDAFHNQMLKIISLVEEPAKLIDTQVKGFEDKQRQQKLQDIRDMYDSKGFWPWLTLERMMERHDSICKKWMNKSCSMKQIESDMTSIQHKMGEDILLINGLKEGAQAALSEYRRTMDATTAMAAGTRYMEARRAEAAAKAAAEATALEDSPLFGENVQVIGQTHILDTDSTQSLQSAPEPSAPVRKEIVFKVFVTREELEKLNSFLTENNIKFEQVNKAQAMV